MGTISPKLKEYQDDFVRRAIPRLQQILYLLEQKEFSRRDVAEMLNISRERVRQLYIRAKELREQGLI